MRRLGARLEMWLGLILIILQTSLDEIWARFLHKRLILRWLGAWLARVSTDLRLDLDWSVWLDLDLSQKTSTQVKTQLLSFWMKNYREQKVIFPDFVFPSPSEEHLKCVKSSHSALKICTVIHQTNDTAQLCLPVCTSLVCECKQASVLLPPAPGLQIIPRLLQNTLQIFCLLSKLIILVGQIKQGALNGTQTWRERSVCVPGRKWVSLCVN